MINQIEKQIAVKSLEEVLRSVRSLEILKETRVWKPDGVGHWKRFSQI